MANHNIQLEEILEDVLALYRKFQKNFLNLSILVIKCEEKGKLRISWSTRTVIQKFLAFLEPKKFQGNN